MNLSKIKGFTLIELLVVIGIIAILAAIVLVAVNPARNFAQARDTQRRNDIYQVLNAIYQYSVSNQGNFPGGISATPTELGTCATCLNLNTVLVPAFIPTIPFDPHSGSAVNTAYLLFQEANGRLTATASGAEITVPITITR